MGYIKLRWGIQNHLRQDRIGLSHTKSIIYGWRMIAIVEIIEARRSRATRDSTTGLRTRNITVPPAGGCSISRVTITKIDAPTASAIVAVSGIRVE